MSLRNTSYRINEHLIAIYRSHYDRDQEHGNSICNSMFDA